MLQLTLNPRPLELRLEALAERLSDLKGLLEGLAPLAARAIERNFDEEGRPRPWPPLTPATLRRKPPGLKILELTGRLRRSIRTRVEGRALVLSTDVPYAAAHQFGLPQRRLPARPFLVLTRENQEEAARALAESFDSTGHESRVTSHG
ncbi:MAG: phage virion morphogenesis protein [Terriglobia bacterium]